MEITLKQLIKMAQAAGCTEDSPVRVFVRVMSGAPTGGYFLALAGEYAEDDMAPVCKNGTALQLTTERLADGSGVEDGGLVERYDAVQAQQEGDDPFYYWTVRFGVHPLWVADGFEMTNIRALGMLAQGLSLARVDSELFAEVIDAPAPGAIRAEQYGAEVEGFKPRMCKCCEHLDGDCPSCNRDNFEEPDHD